MKNAYYDVSKFTLWNKYCDSRAQVWDRSGSSHRLVPSNVRRPWFVLYNSAILTLTPHWLWLQHTPTTGLPLQALPAGYFCRDFPAAPHCLQAFTGLGSDCRPRLQGRAAAQSDLRAGSSQQSAPLPPDQSSSPPNPSFNTSASFFLGICPWSAIPFFYHTHNTAVTYQGWDL